MVGHYTRGTPTPRHCVRHGKPVTRHPNPNRVRLEQDLNGRLHLPRTVFLTVLIEEALRLRLGLGLVLLPATHNVIKDAW